ncbi:hypothetical protein [Nocardioides litoris]|uniref:hypothetical protein n=1 Tax=Nocardioides litoris TaxID=1926648 RepID=UPI001120D87F|nr:hypothetical protein [Nocardioides litoris]
MSLGDRLHAVLASLQWLAVPDSEVDGGFHLRPSDGPAPWPVVAAVPPGTHGVVVLSVLPDPVPADRRDAVVAALGPMNLRTPGGCVEIDLESGEVRARAGLDLGVCEVEDDQLTALVAGLVDASLGTMGAWREVVEAIAGGTDPDDIELLRAGAA